MTDAISNFGAALLRLCLPVVLVALSHAAAWAALHVEPAKVQLRGPLDRRQLVVTLQDTSGRFRDVTAEAAYRCLSPDIAEVTPTGIVLPRGTGTVLIEASGGGEQSQVSVDVQAAGPPVS